MPEASHHTSGVSDGDVVTQSRPIGGQLAFSTRYFDIRPVFDKGSSTYYLGNRVYIGANGQSIENIIDKINSFTANNKELVILRPSHDIEYEDSRVGSMFFQTRWNHLVGKLMRINHRFRATNPTTVDLTTVKLNEFIDGHTAVVIIVKLPSDFTLKSLQRGFLPLLPAGRLQRIFRHSRYEHTN